LIVAGALAALLARRISGPIDSLRLGAAQLGSGRAGHRVSAGGAKEIRLLADDFNHMAEALERSGAELRNSEKLLRDLLESMTVGFVALDNDWRFTYVNARAVEMLGHGADALIGRKYGDVFPEAVGSPFELAYRKVMAERETERTESYFPPWDRWFEQRVDPAPGGISIFFEDVTERRNTRSLLGVQRRALEKVATGSPLAETLGYLIAAIEEQTPGMLGSVLLLDADGRHLRHGAAPSLPPEFVSRVDGEPIGPRAGSCGTAAFRRESVVVDDIEKDPLWEGYRDLALAHGLRACWSTPIFDAGGRVLGTFAMYFKAPGRPAASHMNLISMVTSVAAIAITKAAAESELANLVARLQELSGRLLEVEESERRSINRELHDRIGASLSVLSINLDIIRSRLPADVPRDGADGIADAGRLLKSTSAQVRNVMAELHPPALEDFGLLAALRTHSESLSARVGIPIEVRGTDFAPRPPPAIELSMFRIAQEALANSVKHSGARAIEVGVERVDNRATVSVTDDGVGFVPAAKGARSWGLTIMRERADAAGIELGVLSAPDQGTRVVARAMRSTA
jgi:PAS domain S-box-containing protein